MTTALETIQTFVAPVVMISANGLLCLAFYNRMGSVVNRSREINKERFDLLTRLSALRRQREDSLETPHLEKRIEVLDELGHQLYHRARLLKWTLICLLLSVICMLACSLALGLAPLEPGGDWAALIFFVAGNLIMMGGVTLAVLELHAALDPLLFEHQRME